MPALSAALARVVSVWSNFRSLLNRRSVTIPSLRHRGSRKGTAYRASGAGNSNCRWPGEMIVADQTVTAAAADDGTAAPQVLVKLKEESYPRLEKLWADNKYRNRALEGWMSEHGWYV